jgi:hypothetical protein
MGPNMPADYVLRLPRTMDKIAAFDPFQADLAVLQKQDSTLKLLDESIKSKY